MKVDNKREEIMTGIDPVEFGKLCANSENTNMLVKEMHEEQKDHGERISHLENHNSTVKRSVKWVVGGFTAIGGFISWVVKGVW